MNKSIKDGNYTLGILDTADYTNDELYGGSTGYVKSILPYLTSQKVLIIGQGINGTTPWKHVFLSDGQIVEMKSDDAAMTRCLSVSECELIENSYYHNF